MAKVKRGQRSYDSGDVECFINGIPIDIVKISYSAKQEVKTNRTLKRKSHKYSLGPETFECSIEIMLEDGEVLERAANGKLMGQEAQIDVKIWNDQNVLITDTIMAVFTNQGRDINGDMGLAYSYEMHVLDIEFHNQ